RRGRGPGGVGPPARPHKRNPVAALAVAACTARAPGLVATVLAVMAQEHERAAGGWPAEWEPQRDLLRLVGSAAAWSRELLDGLEVDPARMRANLDATGGLVMAEAAVAALSGPLGPGRARAPVDGRGRRAQAPRPRRRTGPGRGGGGPPVGPARPGPGPRAGRRGGPAGHGHRPPPARHAAGGARGGRPPARRRGRGSPSTGPQRGR